MSRTKERHERKAKAIAQVNAGKITDWQRRPNVCKLCNGSGESGTYYEDGSPRSCTCHRDDRPAVCQHRYAATECQAAYLQSDAEVKRG
jgi:hypothetical protein